MGLRDALRGLAATWDGHVGWASPLDYPASRFEAHHRPYRNLPSLAFFAAWWAVALILGALASLNSIAPDKTFAIFWAYHTAGPGAFGPTDCPLPDAHGRRLLADPPGGDSGAVPLPAWPWWLLAAAGAVGLGLLLLRACRRHALRLVRIGVWGYVVIFAVNLALTAYNLGHGPPQGAAPFYPKGRLIANLVLYGILSAALLCLALFGRRRVDLAGRLLGVSAQTLVANPVLLTLMLGLGLVAAVCVAIPGLLLVLELGAGYRLLPNLARVESSGGGITCVDAQGHQVLCCQFQQSTAHFAFAASWLAATLAWTWVLVSQLSEYVVAGVVAQWYWRSGTAGSAMDGLSFSQDPYDAPGGAAAWRASKERALLSLRHGAGPSAGSIVFASSPAVPFLYLWQALKRAGDTIREQGVLSACLLTLPGRCLWGLLVLMTNLPTAVLAAGGEAYSDAARRTTAVLSGRTFVAFFFAVWLNALAVGFAAFALTMLALVGYVCLYALVSAITGSGPSTFVGLAGLLPVCYIVSLAVLHFLAGLMASICRAVFACWVIEQAGAEAPPTRPEVDDLLSPLIGRTPNGFGGDMECQVLPSNERETEQCEAGGRR